MFYIIRHVHLQKLILCIYMVALHLGNRLKYFYKLREADIPFYAVLQPVPVLKPGTPLVEPETSSQYNQMQLHTVGVQLTLAKQTRVNFFTTDVTAV